MPWRSKCNTYVLLGLTELFNSDNEMTDKKADLQASAIFSVLHNAVGLGELVILLTEGMVV